MIKSLLKSGIKLIVKRKYWVKIKVPKAKLIKILLVLITTKYYFKKSIIRKNCCLKFSNSFIFSSFIHLSFKNFIKDDCIRKNAFLNL